MSNVHVVVLFDRFGPYHRARLEEAGRKMEVTAVEVAGESATYAWEKVEQQQHFRRLTLFPDTDSASVAPGEKETAIRDELDRLRPDTVAIPGWSLPRALIALRWCVQRRTPAVVMTASTEQDFVRRWWKEKIKERIVSHFGAGLAGGTRHRAYLQKLGVPEECIFLGYDVVENSHFSEGARRAREQEESLREQLSLPERYFLGVSRFVPKKNLPRLIRAYARYREQAPEQPWELVLLGEGPERGAVEKVAKETGVHDTVRLPGFKPYDELPFYYGLAGAFVHGSVREQWGLVVNEAMAAGLPVLVSGRCGCAPDLVEEGENGYTFDPYAPATLADLMVRIGHGTDDRREMGVASQRIIDDWGPDRFSTGLEKATETALEVGPAHYSSFDQLLMKVLTYG